MTGLSGDLTLNVTDWKAYVYEGSSLRFGTVQETQQISFFIAFERDFTCEWAEMTLLQAKKHDETADLFGDDVAMLICKLLLAHLLSWKILCLITLDEIW